MKLASKPIILCVDDEKTVLDSLEEQILRKLSEDFDCELSQGAEEALELIEELEEEGRSIAVVVSDQLMPGMKGDEFLIRLHGSHPETLKILLTGQANLEHVRNAINKASLYRYVNKPWEENDLMLTIEEAAKSYQQYLLLVEFNNLLKTLNKATQEISGEVSLQNIIQKLMKSAMESTGAEKGFLLINENGVLLGKAAASIIQEENRKLQQQLAENSAQLSQGLLQLIETYQQNPSKTPFRYIANLQKHGNHLGYVIVENNLTKTAIEEEQAEVVSMLAAQAAISIDNARLYSSLETKNNELREEKEKIEKINQVIEEQNKNITDSIIYAQRIQDTILPKIQQLKEVFPNSFILFKPKDIVSGDFYWWSDRGERFMIAAVDCTGHGIPGAFMSVIGSSFLNQVVNEYSVTEPEAILQYLDLHVKSTLKQDTSNAVTKDGMDVAFCTLDFKNKVIEYAGAYRPLYLVRKKEVIEYEPTKCSIGGKYYGEGEPSFHGMKIPIEYGDMLYLFSDGFADQFGGPKKKKLTSRYFRELLIQVNEQPMDIQYELLNHKFESWRGDEPQTDDVLVIGLCFDHQEFA